MNIKKYVLLAYRNISFLALIGLFLGIIWYAVGFILMSGGLSNWSVPIVLSPTQERVLSFQPLVVNLEANYLKQKVELATANSKIDLGMIELKRINSLLDRINKAQKIESNALTLTNKNLSGLIANKSKNIEDTDKLIKDISELLNMVDEEEKAYLITKDQAAQRRISLRNTLNQATDAKLQYLNASELDRQYNTAAGTLRGGNTSLQALQSLQSEQSLRMMGTQLEIEIESSILAATALVKNISELERVLNTAKESPQYRALRHSVNVLFAPYTSLEGVKIKDNIYECYFMYILCRKVGTVKKIYTAEEYARHPFLKTDLKGHLVEVEYSYPEAAMSQVIFIKNKPLLI